LIKVYSLWGEQLKEKVPEMVDSFALKVKGRKTPVFRIVALKVDSSEGRDRVLHRLKNGGPDYNLDLLPDKTIPEVAPEAFFLSCRATSVERDDYLATLAAEPLDVQ
ncbi:hypothetical protein FOZ63_022880, partial [Perkinsus olseni]